MYSNLFVKGEVLFSSQSAEGVQDGQHLYDCFELGQVVEMEGVHAVPLEGNELHPGLEAVRIRKFGEIREGVGWVSIMYDTYGAIISAGLPNGHFSYFDIGGPFDSFATLDDP